MFHKFFPQLYDYHKRYRTRIKDTYLEFIREIWSKKNKKYTRDKNYDLFISHTSIDLLDSSDRAELDFIGYLPDKITTLQHNEYKVLKIKTLKLFYLKYDEFGFFINFLFDTYFPNYSKGVWLYSYSSIYNFLKNISLKFTYFKKWQNKWFIYFLKWLRFTPNIQLLLQGFFYSFNFLLKGNFFSFYSKSIENWFFYKRSSSFIKVEKVTNNIDLNFKNINLKNSYQKLFKTLKTFKTLKNYSRLKRSSLKINGKKQRKRIRYELAYRTTPLDVSRHVLASKKLKTNIFFKPRKIIKKKKNILKQLNIELEEPLELEDYAFQSDLLLDNYKTESGKFVYYEEDGEWYQYGRDDYYFETDLEESLSQINRKNFSSFFKKKKKSKFVNFKKLNYQTLTFKKLNYQTFSYTYKNQRFLLPNLQTFIDNSVYFSIDSYFNYSAGLTNSVNPDFFWDDWESTFLDQQNGSRGLFFDTMYDEGLGLHRMQRRKLPMFKSSNSCVVSPKFGKRTRKFLKKELADRVDLSDLRIFFAYHEETRLQRSPLWFSHAYSKSPYLAYYKGRVKRSRRRQRLGTSIRSEPDWKMIDFDPSFKPLLGFNPSISSDLTEVDSEDQEYLRELIEIADGPSQYPQSEGPTADELPWEETVIGPHLATNRYYNTNILFDWYSLSRFNPRFGGHNHRLFDLWLGNKYDHTKQSRKRIKPKKRLLVKSIRNFPEYKLKFFAPLDAEVYQTEQIFSSINAHTPSAIIGRRELGHRTYNFLDPAYNNRDIFFDFMVFDRLMNIVHDRDYQDYEDDEYDSFNDDDDDELTFDVLSDYKDNTSWLSRFWRRQNSFSPSLQHLDAAFTYNDVTAGSAATVSTSKEQRDFFYSPKKGASAYIDDTSNLTYNFTRFYEKVEHSLPSSGVFFAFLTGLFLTFVTICFYHPFMEYYEFILDKRSIFYDRDQFSIFGYPKIGINYIDLYKQDHPKTRIYTNGYSLLETVTHPYYVRYNSARQYGLTHQNNLLDYQFMSTIRKFHPNLFSVRFDISSQLGLINEVDWRPKYMVDEDNTNYFDRVHDNFFNHLPRKAGKPTGWYFPLFPRRPVLIFDMHYSEFTPQFAMSNSLSWLESDLFTFRGFYDFIGESDYTPAFTAGFEPIKTEFRGGSKQPRYIWSYGVNEYDEMSTERTPIQVSSYFAKYILPTSEEDPEGIALKIMQEKNIQPNDTVRIFKVFPFTPNQLLHMYGHFMTDTVNLSGYENLTEDYLDKQIGKTQKHYENTLFFGTKVNDTHLYTRSNSDDLTLQGFYRLLNLNEKPTNLSFSTHVGFSRDALDGTKPKQELLSNVFTASHHAAYTIKDSSLIQRYLFAIWLKTDAPLFALYNKNGHHHDYYQFVDLARSSNRADVYVGPDTVLASFNLDWVDIFDNYEVDYYYAGVEAPKKRYNFDDDYEEFASPVKMYSKQFVKGVLPPYFLNSWDLQNIFSTDDRLFPGYTKAIPNINFQSVLNDIYKDYNLYAPYSLSQEGYSWYPNRTKGHGEYKDYQIKADPWRGPLSRVSNYLYKKDYWYQKSPHRVSFQNVNSFITKYLSLKTENTSGYLRYILLTNYITGYNQLFTTPATLFSYYQVDSSAFITQTGLSETIFRSPLFFYNNFMLSFPTLWETYNNHLWLNNYSDNLRLPNPLGSSVKYENNAKVKHYLVFWFDYVEPQIHYYFIKFLDFIKYFLKSLWFFFFLGFFYLLHDSYFVKYYLFKENTIVNSRLLNTQINSEDKINITEFDKHNESQFKVFSNYHFQYKFLSPERPFTHSRINPSGKVQKRLRRDLIQKQSLLKLNKVPKLLKSRKSHITKSFSLNKDFLPATSLSYSFLWRVPAFINLSKSNQNRVNLKRRRFLSYNKKYSEKKVSYLKQQPYSFISNNSFSSYLIRDKSFSLEKSSFSESKKSLNELISLKTGSLDLEATDDEMPPDLHYTDEQWEGLMPEDITINLTLNERLAKGFEYINNDSDLYKADDLSVDDEVSMLEKLNEKINPTEERITYQGVGFNPNSPNLYRYRVKPTARAKRTYNWSISRFNERKNNQLFQKSQSVKPVDLVSYIKPYNLNQYYSSVNNIDLNYIDETHSFDNDAISEFNQMNIKFVDPTLVYSFNLDLSSVTDNGFITELDDMSEDFDYEDFDEEFDDHMFSAHKDMDSGDTTDTLFEELVLKVSPDFELAEFNVKSIVTELFKKRISKFNLRDSRQNYKISEYYKNTLNLSSYQSIRTLNPDNFSLELPSLEASISRNYFIDEQIVEHYFFSLTNHGLDNIFLSLFLTPFSIPVFFRRIKSYFKTYTNDLTEKTRYSRKTFLESDHEIDYRQARRRLIHSKLERHRLPDFTGIRRDRRLSLTYRKFIQNKIDNKNLVFNHDEYENILSIYDANATDFLYKKSSSLVAEDYFNSFTEHSITDTENLYAIDYHEDSDDYFYQLPDYIGIYYRWRYCSRYFLKLLSYRPTEFYQTQLTSVLSRSNLVQYTTMLSAEDLNYSYEEDTLNEWVSSWMLTLAASTYVNIVEAAEDHQMLDYDDEEDDEGEPYLLEDNIEDEDQDDDEDEIEEFEILHELTYLNAIPEFVFDIALYNVSPSDFTIESQKWSLNPFVKRNVAVEAGLLVDHMLTATMFNSRRTLAIAPFSKYWNLETNQAARFAKYFRKPAPSLATTILSTGSTIISGVTPSRGLPCVLPHQTELQNVPRSVMHEAHKKILLYRASLKMRGDLRSGVLRYDSDVVTLKDMYDFLVLMRSPLIRTTKWSFWFPFSIPDYQHKNALRTDEDYADKEGQYYPQQLKTNTEYIHDRFIPVRFAVLSALYFSDYNYQYRCDF